MEKERKVGIKCPDCKETVFSRGHRHNFVTCSCWCPNGAGGVAADGGDSYDRFLGKEHPFDLRYEDGTKVPRDQDPPPSSDDSARVMVLAMKLFNIVNVDITEHGAYVIARYLLNSGALEEIPDRSPEEAVRACLHHNTAVRELRGE